MMPLFRCCCHFFTALSINIYPGTGTVYSLLTLKNHDFTKKYLTSLTIRVFRCHIHVVSILISTLAQIKILAQCHIVLISCGVYYEQNADSVACMSSYMYHILAVIHAPPVCSASPCFSYIKYYLAPSVSPTEHGILLREIPFSL